MVYKLITRQLYEIIKLCLIYSKTIQRNNTCTHEKQYNTGNNNKIFFTFTIYRINILYPIRMNYLILSLIKREYIPTHLIF